MKIKNRTQNGRIQSLYEQVKLDSLRSEEDIRLLEQSLATNPLYESLRSEIVRRRGLDYFESLLLKESSIIDLKRVLRSIKIKDNNKLNEYMSIGSKNFPNYDLKVPNDKVLLFHNTTDYNAEKIAFEGLKAFEGARQGRGKDGDFVWATSAKNLKGYGGYTVAFVVNKDLASKYKVNDTEYTFPFDIPPEDIMFIDEPIGIGNYRESDVKNLINKLGREKVAEVLSNKTNYDGDSLGELISQAERLDESSYPMASDIMKRIITDALVGFQWKIDYSVSKQRLKITSKNDKFIGTVIFNNRRGIFYIHIWGQHASIEIPDSYDKDDTSYEDFIKSIDRTVSSLIKQAKSNNKKDNVSDVEIQDSKDNFTGVGPDEDGNSYYFQDGKRGEVASDSDLDESVKSDIENLNNKYKDVLAYPIESFRNREYADDKKSKYATTFVATIKRDPLDLKIFAKSVEDLQSKIESTLSNDLHESQNLSEANLLDLINDSKATDSKRIDLASTIYTDYKGVDSDGTLLFESDSQTRSGLVHRQRVFYPGFFDLLDTVDAGDEITEEQVVDIITNDLMVDCSCESFLYYAWAYKSWKNDYGLMKEIRAPKKNNVKLKGGACKHVLSVLDLLNRSNTLFEQVTKDLNVLFQKYKKRPVDQPTSEQSTDEQDSEDQAE